MKHLNFNFFSIEFSWNTSSCYLFCLDFIRVNSVTWFFSSVDSCSDIFTDNTNMSGNAQTKALN